MTPEEVVEIQKWFLNHGGAIHSSVEIFKREHVDSGYGLRIREGLHMETRSHVISCPHSLTISVLDLDQVEQLWPPEFLEHWEQAPEVLTRFFLMEQWHLKENSHWWPYLRMLPQPCSSDVPKTPMFYGEEDLVWIRGTNLDGSRESRMRAWQQEFETSKTMLKKFDEKKFIFLGNFDLYLWAATMLTSRCFSQSALANGETYAASKRQRHVFPVLLPVFDLANHNPMARVTWEWDKSHCTLTSNDEIRSGQEIYNNYGPKGNEELIMGYGFSLPNNGADAVALATAGPVPKADLVDATFQRKYISENSNDQSRAFCEEGLTEENIQRTQAQIIVNLQSTKHPIPTPQETFYLRTCNNKANPLEAIDAKLLVRLSRILANERERKNNGHLKQFTERDANLTRLTIKIVTHLLMILQRQHHKIASHQSSLPTNPNNDTQIHAKRYHESQMFILSSHISAFDQWLRTNVTASSTPRLVNLETILTNSPPSFQPTFRAAIHHVLRTRQARKIQEGGYQDLVMTLWICTLWLSHDNDASAAAAAAATGENVGNSHMLDKPRDSESYPSPDPFHTRLGAWLHFLHSTYCLPHGGLNASRTCPSPGRVCPPAHFSSKVLPRDDTLAVARSYVPVLHAIALRFPESLYVNPRWDVEFLAWGLWLWRQERCVVPDGERSVEAEGSEDNGDEECLFLEILEAAVD